MKSYSTTALHRAAALWLSSLVLAGAAGSADGAPPPCPVRDGTQVQFQASQSVDRIDKALDSIYPERSAAQIRAEMGKFIDFHKPDAQLRGLMILSANGLGCLDYEFESVGSLSALTAAARAQVTRAAGGEEGLQSYLQRRPVRVRVEVDRGPRGNPIGRASLDL